MGVTRDISKAIVALPEYAMITCSSDLVATKTSTARVFEATTPLGATTAWSLGISGTVIDRLSPELGARYQFVDVYAYMFTTVGSTWGCTSQQLMIDCYLQHGSSGSGGDAVNLSSGRKAAARYANTTGVQTTASYSFSTGPVNIQTNPATWDLSAANRYLRVKVSAGNTHETTESTGMEGAHIGAIMVFRGADVLPERANTTGAFSTTTSTST